jgi:hypothetical protein
MNASGAAQVVVSIEAASGRRRNGLVTGDGGVWEGWTEVSAFWPLPMNDSRPLGGLKILSLGEPFASAAYSGQCVPYEIQLKDGLVRKNNLALKQDGKGGRWYVDGGL